MLHIYFGNGKGKTTAAVGLAVRANGAGMKVAFFQFLKNGSSSEITVLHRTGISVFFCEKCNKFTFSMNEQELNEVTQQHNEMLRKAADLLEKGEVQLLVLDEFLDAYNKELVDTEFADYFIDNIISKGEVVMTGREPANRIRESADYITEMIAVKHPYTKGITARKGIEY